MEYSAASVRIPHQEAQWQNCAGKPFLANGEVHLWRVNLMQFSENPNLGLVLSPQERTRLDRLIPPRKKEEFSTSRWALRLIIGRYLNVDPGAMIFSNDAHGKPSLRYPHDKGRIYFNLSHTSGWLLIGICGFAELGVDIEKIRPVSRSWALEHLFSAAERDLYSTLPNDQVDAFFISGWTRKEALAKAAGFGLFELAQKEDRQVQVVGQNSGNGYLTYWCDPYCVYQFQVAPGLIGAAAIAAGREISIRFHEFQLEDFSQIQ